MNAPSEISDFQLASESLTARQWATILQITPKAFNLRKIGHADQRVVRGGLTKFYAFEALPEDYRGTLTERKTTLRCLRFADLLDVQTRTAWAPEKPFKKLPEATQDKAIKVQQVLAVFFAAQEQGMTSRDAETKTRAAWLQMFGRNISDRQIRRIVKRVEARGGAEFAPLDAYADGKSVAHHKARLLNKKSVPDEFIRAFKTECLRPGVGMISAVYRNFEMAWMDGKEVPGFGFRTRPNEEFPMTLEEIRTCKIAPSRAAMLQAGRGKFAAKVEGALPTMNLSSAGLRRCERYLFDDTRLNIACLDDRNGQPIELKSYWCMEESTRQIVGYLVRQAGDCRASDVDALVARVLRTCGIAAPGAGYSTTLKFERGTVACSPARQVYLESMFPGQVKISRTEMIGGQNAPGDFAQENSGNFFGKGKIESFMRTLDFFCRHIAGQRGGIYSKQPAMLGSAGLDRKHNILRFSPGSQIDEGVLTAQAARAIAMLESKGNDHSPDARMACQAFSIQTPLYYMSEVLAALERVISYYNQRRGHRMEGFRQIAMEKNVGGASVPRPGGLTYVTESPNDKARRTELELESLGKSPMRISPADACALLLKAKKVTCKPTGVSITINGKAHRFWDPNSLAVAEVQKLATLEREYIALFDPDCAHEIYLLQNTAGNYPDRAIFDFSGTARFLEALPLDAAADVTDSAAMSRAQERNRQNHNRITREVVRDLAPYLRDQDDRRTNTVETLLKVMATHRGDQRHTNLESALSDNISDARTAKPARSRAEEQPTEEANFAAYLAAAHPQE